MATRGGLEHHMSQQAPPSCNGALSAHGSTVMSDGREAREGSSLFPRDLTKFRHFGNQHGAGDGANPRDRPQNTRSLGQLFIQGDNLLNLCFQPCNLAIKKAFELGAYGFEHISQSQFPMSLDLGHKAFSRFYELSAL